MTYKYIVLLIITNKGGIINNKISIKFTRVKFSFLTFLAIKKDMIQKTNPPNIKDAKNKRKIKTAKSAENKCILARAERLELPTPGFGDLCSTN